MENRQKNKENYKKLLTKTLTRAIIYKLLGTGDTVFATMAQLVEHILGKDEVISSTLISSSSI